MAFARDASNHQGSGRHEAGPYPANRVNQLAEPGRQSDQKVLVEQKERLHGAGGARVVPEDEIAVVEFGMKRVLDELVVAMILAFLAKRVVPERLLPQTVARNDVDIR